MLRLNDLSLVFLFPNVQPQHLKKMSVSEVFDTVGIDIKLINSLNRSSWEILRLLITISDHDRIDRRNSRFLQSPHCVANGLQYVRSCGQGAVVCKSRATHRARITCNMSGATWHEGTTQPLSLTELKLHLFELHCIA